MNTHSPYRTHRLHSSLVLLAALGLLTVSGVSRAQVDTSQWKCERCPYPKEMRGAIDAGLGVVSADSRSFGNYTGLESKGAHLVLGGEVRVRGEGGYFAQADAADLGIKTRRLTAQSGHEGLYSLQLGYAEIPRTYADGARTPFAGNGGSVLTLPAGFASASTATMPLTGTLQPLELDSTRSRFDLGGRWVGLQDWTFKADFRRDVKDGTRPTSGAFFSSASQLAGFVDQTTDQIELGAAYRSSQWHASVGYLLSQFRNGSESLTWDNPFLPVVAGATRGQLALAPNNQFQQIVASGGYQILPMVRASADIAIGQGTQNAGYLPSTLNTALAVGALPAASLDGRVDTFNANAKVTATPLPGLRLNASYARDVRDNRTPVLAYPQVSNDMFVSLATRSNTPFSLTQDRIKLNADYRGPATWRFAGGVDWDQRDRNYSEAVRTRETTVWGRANVQPMESLGLSFNLAHAERTASTYGIAYWFVPENPLLRKLNLAERRRDAVGARGDWTVSEALSLGFGAEYSNDEYPASTVGLNSARTLALNADVTFALSEQTRFTAYAQSQKKRSRQSGSELFAAPDWTGSLEDRVEMLGIGVRHALIPDKLDIGGDATATRTRSATSVQTAAGEAPFPRDSTALGVVKVFASYKLQTSLWLNASWWYEQYSAADWRLAGVQPNTVFNLLAFGNQPAHYHVQVLRVSARYLF